MKTVNVNVIIQLDINDNESLLTEVQTEIDKINAILLQHTSFGSDAVIFVNAIDKSDITEMENGMGKEEED